MMGLGRRTRSRLSSAEFRIGALDGIVSAVGGGGRVGDIVDGGDLESPTVLQYSNARNGN